MTIHIKHIVGACLLAWAGTAAQAATDDWKGQYEQAIQRYQAQDLDGAEKAARAALKIAETGKGNTKPYMASSLNMLAMIHNERGEYDKAIELQQRSLTLSEQSLGKHTNTASLAYNLGNMLDEQGRREEALGYYQRGLEMVSGLPSNAQNDTLKANLNAALGRVYAAMGNQAEAERYTSALLGSSAELPPLVRADGLTRQARVQEARGDWEQARASLDEALQLRRQALGENDISVAQSQGELAALLNRQGLHDEAAPLHQAALALRERINPDDPGMAGHLNELAIWHMSRKEYAQAEPLLARALALVQRGQGEQSLAAAHLLSSQARLREDQNDEAGANALYQQALDAYAAHGDDQEALLGQAQILNNMAGPVYRKRRFAEAEKLFLQSLALSEQAVGANDARLLPVLENLHALCVSQGRSADASGYGQRIEAIKKESGEGA